ncbi:MAG: hypothetical protein K5643_09720 [Saccharofermentans sp.]|nr:hypothetical protein [Saccharofermentans sp.]
MDLVRQALYKAGAFLKKNFEVPKSLNWGYPVLFAGIGAVLALLIRLAVVSLGVDYSQTSIIGYVLFLALFVLMAFIIPAVLLAGRFTRYDAQSPSAHVVGDYTGIGVLILSLLSGAPLMLLKSSAYNIFCYLWLRSGNSIKFPLFFCYVEDPTILEIILEFLSGTVIPAIGISLFFYGILWSAVRIKDFKAACVVIPLLYALFSFNLFDIAGALIAGWWLCILRRNTENIWGPALCLIGCKATELVIGSTIPTVDITEIRIYSDISSKFFYSSVPSIFVGVILFAFFYKVLGEFHITMTNSSYGDNLKVIEAEKLRDGSIPPFINGINLALLIGVIAAFVIWFVF